MYSKIPMPHLNLEEKDMRYVMGFFPLVGLVLGACQFIWYKLSVFLGVPNVSRALIFLVLPVIVTGGIHVDGYMDTSDAIHSYGDREKKLSILKDSHIGAFAVIRLLVYSAVYFAALFWMAEQGMLQMVRTGDMNYKQALSNSMSISAGVPVQSSDVLRQSKTSIIVFTSLVCRAAIEGGLSPEEAYSLGDSYIQAAESAKSLDELSPLAMMMYDDFIRRVHKHRTNPNLSRQIQKCVDYIEMNLDKKIVAEDLAALVGYTEYYLTHKFKEETGLSVTNYVKFAKVERAKVLLKSTPFSVREISEQLGFATRNYFSAVFQQVTGKTPMEFRET